jgi:hypothetical protein
MSGADMPVFDATVSRKEIETALERIRILNKGKKPYDLLMSFEDAELILETPKTTKTVKGTGTATVQIKMPGGVLVRMIGAFPETDQIRFQLDGDHIKIGRLTLPCAVTESA